MLSFVKAKVIRNYRQAAIQIYQKEQFTVTSNTTDQATP